MSVYPSGSINFSRFSDSVLSFKLSQNNPKSLIYIYVSIKSVFQKATLSSQEAVIIKLYSGQKSRPRT